jgi:ATP-dependent Lhr-like helicase
MLLEHLRRMEDRGEVNGGRFVDGFSGEQFALPEAVGLLRRSRAKDSESRWSVINATDPLNLGGIITPGVKTASRVANQILLDRGVPAARLLGDELELLKGASKDVESIVPTKLFVGAASRRESARRREAGSVPTGNQADAS